MSRVPCASRRGPKLGPTCSAAGFAGGAPLVRVFALLLCGVAGVGTLLGRFPRIDAGWLITRWRRRVRTGTSRFCGVGGTRCFASLRSAGPGRLASPVARRLVPVGNDLFAWLWVVVVAVVTNRLKLDSLLHCSLPGPRQVPAPWRASYAWNAVFNLGAARLTCSAATCV
jgi:hypothetical protein